MSAFSVGDVVAIRAEWRDRPEEAGARYRVTENNGDRLFIELECALPIRPVELVRPFMIERVRS